MPRYKKVEDDGDRIYHKIEAGNIYTVWKNYKNDKEIYKIQVTQTNYTGTKDKYYMLVRFKRNISLKNQTNIIIHKAYENVCRNKKDPYNPIVYLLITEFEIVERKTQKKENAYENYRQILFENENEVEEEYEEALLY